MTAFSARFGNALLFLGILALAGVTHTGSARAMDVPGLDAIIWQQEFSSQSIGAAPIRLVAPQGTTASFVAGPVGVCAADGDLLQIIAAGRCTVTASLSIGGGSPIVREKAFTIRAQQAQLTLNVPVRLQYEDSYELSVGGGTTGGEVSYTAVGDCDIVRNDVTGKSRVRALSGKDKCLVEAIMAGDDDYEPVSDSKTFDLEKADQSVNWPDFPTTVGESFDLDDITLSSGFTPDAVEVSPLGVCEKTNSGRAELTGPGICFVAVRHPGDDENYNAVSEVSGTRQFQVSAPPPKQPQSITWTQTLSATFGGSDIPLTAEASSGLGVSYETAQSEFCSIVDGNKLKINGAGPCTVTASQGGNASYAAAAPLEKTFTIAKAEQDELEIFAPLSLTYRGSVELSVRGGSTNGRVTYLALSDRCTINRNTVTAASGSDSCVVEAIMAGNANYEIVGATATIDLVKASQSVILPVLPTTVGAIFNKSSITLDSGLTPTVEASPPEVCADTNSGTAVELKGEGDCTVRVRHPGDANYTNVAENVVLVVGFPPKQEQLITWTQTLSATFGDPDITLTASASSGLGVSYVAAQSEFCSIVDGNKLKINGAGPCTVTASQDGNASYASAAPLEKTFTIAKAEQAALTINAPLMLTYKGSVQLSVAGGSTNGRVTYSALDNARCTINGNTVTAASGSGDCVVDATMAGNANYEIAVAMATITLVKADQNALNFQIPALAVGQEITLSATGGTGDATVTFAVVDGSSAFCQLQPANVLKGISPGTCQVTATKLGGANYSDVSSLQSVVVKAPRVQQSAFTITAPSSLLYNEKASLSVAGGSGSGAVTYQVISGPCTVSDNDVTANSGTGTCEITATKAGDDTYEEATTAPATIELEKRSQEFMSQDKMVFGSGDTLDLITAIKLSSMRPATFSVASTPQGVCAITGSDPGTLQFIAPGACVLTASSGGDDNYEGVSQTWTFTVLKKTQWIEWDQILSATFGDPDITLTASASSNLPVSFVASPTDVCTVEGSKLKIKKGGQCTVTASQAGNDEYATAQSVSKTFTIKRQQAPLKLIVSEFVSYGVSAILSVEDGSTQGAVTFQLVSGNCEVSNTGGGNYVTPNSGDGQCTIRATMAGNDEYADVSDDATITLQRASQSVDWPRNLTFTVGDETDLPLVSSGLPATYRAVPENTGGCEITGEPPARLKFNKPGRCSVTVSQGGDHRFFEIAGDTNTFTVNAASKQQQQPFSISPLSSTLIYNDTASFSVDGGSGTGAVTYQVTSGSCTVSGNVVRAGSGVNDCKVTATKAGDDTYEAATTAPATIHLRKRAQDVIWEDQTGFNTGESLNLATIPLNSRLPATFSVASTSQGVCAITGSNPGTLQFIAPGKCDLTASSDGDDNYEEVSRTRTFTVKANQTGFALTIASLSVGQEIRLSATGGQGSGDVVYQSLTPSRCSIADGNLLTGLVAGACQVTARKLDDGTYNEATATASIEVGLPRQNELIVQASGPLPYPGKVSLSATGGTGAGAVTYQVVSGPCSVADNQLSSTGLGTCRVTAVKASDGNYQSVTSAPLDIVVGEGIAAKPAEDIVRQSMFDMVQIMFGFQPHTDRLDARNGGGGTTAFLPQGTSSNGTIAFSASSGQIVEAAGKGDMQVMPTSAQRPDQGYDPYLKTPGSVDVWIDGRFIWRNGADSGGGLDQRAFLVETGVDYLVTETLLIGLSLRLDTNDAKLGGAGGDLDTLGWLAGPYVVWEIAQGLQADARLSYGQSRNDISVIVSGSRFDGSYDTTRWMAEAGLRGSLDLDTILIEPGLRAAFYRETAEAFTLSGGGGVVQKQELSMMRLSFDPRLTYLHRTEEGTSITPFLSPQLSAEWKETKGGREDDGWDVFGVVEGGLSIATEDFSLSTNLSASGLGRKGALSYSAGANLTIPLN